MITEDYVSFETAKLLKEKGFDEDIARVVNEECEIDYLGSFQPSLAYLHHTWYRCPTLQLAMKWLREVHKIHVSVEMGFDVDNHQYFFFVPSICKFSSKTGEYQTPFGEKEFDFYEEACEAAIKYCLENLI